MTLAQEILIATGGKVHLHTFITDMPTALMQVMPRFPLSERCLADGRRHVSCLLAMEKHPLAEREADILLAFGEAATNAIVHACGGTVTVCQKRTLTEVTLQVWVADSGPGLGRVSKALLEEGFTTKPDGIGGWGKQIIRNLADRVDLYTSPHGTVLCLTFTA